MIELPPLMLTKQSNKSNFNKKTINTMAAGNFTASELLESRLKAEQYWKNAQNAATYKPKAGAAQAVLANQTQQFSEFEDENKDRKVRVTWIDACGVDVQDCVSNCEITEPELETKSKLYTPDICKKVGFSVDFTKLRTNDYTSDEIVMRGIASRVKALDEFWAKQILIKLATYAGINVAPAPWTFVADDMTTYVPDAQYNLKMLANVLNQAELNRMDDNYIIENGTLTIEMMNAAFDSGNLDGKGDATRANEFQKLMTSDQFNFAASGITEDMFVIGKGAVAFQTLNEVAKEVNLIGGKVQVQTFQTPSIALPGVMYDTYYSVECKTINNKAHYFHTWRFETHGIVALNPEGCPVTVGGNVYTPTGVLSYTKGLPSIG